MSRRIRNMYAALEVYEELEPSMPIEEAEVGIATSDAEISEIQANIDAHEDAMNTLVEDQKTIDNLEAQVNQTVQSGEGTTEENAELVQVVVESIFRRHGLGRRNYPRVNLSNESFKTKADRVKVARKLVKNLRVSKEGIGQAIADVIAKICEFFRDLFKKLMGKSNYSSGSSNDANKALNEASKESDEGDKTPMVFSKSELIKMVNRICTIYKVRTKLDNKPESLANGIKGLQSKLEEIPIFASEIANYSIESNQKCSETIKHFLNEIDNTLKAVKECSNQSNEVEKLENDLNQANDRLNRFQEEINSIKEEHDKFIHLVDEAQEELIQAINDNEKDNFSTESFTIGDMRKLRTLTVKATSESKKLDSEINKLLTSAESIDSEIKNAVKTINSRKEVAMSEQNNESSSPEQNPDALGNVQDLLNKTQQLVGATVKNVSSATANSINAAADMEKTVNETAISSSRKITSNMKVWKSKNVGDDVTSIYERLYTTCQKKCEQRGDKWIKVRE